ncbi:MAG: DUF2269 family protein, partial [Gemmatimonadetes bacterium]|nr:DUF2269 family protein [Gemmatimonadota bacterium]NIT88251.1 DUF2269 family protein [Gemmatimonadota bacterium]NIU32057.1 DUF2269 family protein [Gemmatimonadota bacterium]NIV62428.1 DUF2269 family protein [Gemmatimonadota bacterium]NIW65161.1 DUF2269 family protein [Gemmatimonadota bacterium]
LAAWLLSAVAGWEFGTTWIVASLLLFVVPGTIAVIQIKREERADALRAAEARDEARDTGDREDDG